MRFSIRLCLIVAFCNTAVTAFGQFTPKEDLADEIRNECTFINKYTAAQRSLFYPFNKASKIILISFEEYARIPVKNNKVDWNLVLEKQELTSNQTDSLTSLIYNVGYTPLETPLSFTSFIGAGCYEPRNGMLFFNKSNKLTAYIEICFACQGVRKSSKRINDGEYCSTKFDLLRNFFQESGIKYGTKSRDSVLTYDAILKLDTSQVAWQLRNKLNNKSNGGKNLAVLNAAEKVLLLSANADDIYDGHATSGLSKFYLGNAGNYLDETITALKTIHSDLTLKTLQASKLQWPQQHVPKDIATRRKLLLNIINEVDPEWQKLEDGLFDHKEEVGGETLTRKEDIDTLILKFTDAHRSELID